MTDTPKPNAWIVVGSTGEYSDFHCWNVCAYTSKRKATAHAKKAEKWERDYDRKMKGQGVYRWSDRQGKNPYDLSGDRDYTGTHYEVVDLYVDGLEVEND